MSVEVVRKPKKPLPEEVAEVWAREWALRKERRLTGRGSCHLGASGCCLAGGWWSVPFCVDLPQPEDGQRLREVMRHRGGLYLRGDEPPHGEAFGPCVGVSRQSLYEVR